MASVDLPTGEAVLDEFDERVVEGRAALRAVVGRGHHLADHLAVSLPGIDQRPCDVVEYADEPLRDRLVASGEDHVVQVDQPALGQRADHVLPGGEVVEEGAAGDVGALADLVDPGG